MFCVRALVRYFFECPIKDKSLLPSVDSDFRNPGGPSQLRIKNHAAQSCGGTASRRESNTSFLTEITDLYNKK